MSGAFGVGLVLLGCEPVSEPCGPRTQLVITVFLAIVGGGNGAVFAHFNDGDGQDAALAQAAQSMLDEFDCLGGTGHGFGAVQYP